MRLFEYNDNPHLAYLVHTELKKALMNIIGDIIQLTQTKMKSHKNHFFNFIKQCPFCNTIWLKVAGCGGATTCGEFPVSDEYFNDYKMPQKYEFNITEKEITYKIDENYQKHQDDLSEQKNQFWKFWLKLSTSPQLQYKIPDKARRIGCGKPIVWDEIPPLSNKVLKELVDPGLMDYFIKVDPNEELQKLLMKAQKSVKDQVEQIKKDNKVIKL